MNQIIKELRVLKDVGMENVTLLDEFLKNAERRDLEFILGINQSGYAPQQKLDPYRFLAHFYTTARLPRPESAKVYEDSWERSKDNNFRGHMFGHYMSALALAYSGGKDPEIKAQLMHNMYICVTELKKCQDAFASIYPDRAGYIAPFGDVRLDAIDGLTGGVGNPVEGTVFVPWYNLHKVLAGLLDIYRHASGVTKDKINISELALTIAKRFGDYFYHVRASKYTSENKEKMLATEYGGMNDAFYDLYNLTGDQKYRICAEMFDEVSLFDELAKGNNILPGKHANTQVPKFIGALKRYTTLTQNEAYYQDLTPVAQADLPKYLLAVKNFFDIVLENHSYITGGNSCDEHFHAPDTLAATINRDATHETCNVHNMLKIARELFKITQDKKYADYYENAFVNAILSAQNPETGEMMYFQPMGSGYYKLFRHGLFWCCTGTGIENYVKLGDSIYFNHDESIYVNLYFSSEYRDEARNLKLTQQADILNGNYVIFTVETLDGSDTLPKTDFYLRVPNWQIGEVSMVVNGVNQKAPVVDGYLVVSGMAVGGRIELIFSKEIGVNALKDNPNVMAFSYGPVVLSAGLGMKDLDATNPNGIMVLVPKRDNEASDVVRITNGQSVAEWKADLAKHFVPVGGAQSEGIQFKLEGTELDDELIYTPHYKKYQERYGLYLRFTDPESEAMAKAAMLAEKQALLAREGATAYLENFDNHAYEAEYNLKQDHTATGSWAGKSLRFGHGEGSWFSYDLPVEVNVRNYLNSILARNDKGRSWAIYVNDVFLEEEIVTHDGTTEDAYFYTSTKEIPNTYLSGSGVRWHEDGTPYVTVKFMSTGGLVGGIFGIMITTERRLEK